MVDFFLTEIWPLVLFLWPYIKIPVYFIIIIVPLLIVMAYFTYWERKFIGWMQYRRGPNVVGPLGLLQPFADGLKPPPAPPSSQLHVATPWPMLSL